MLAVTLHPQFYRHAKVRSALLDDPFDTPDDRMRRLGTTVPNDVWAQIRRTPRGSNGLD